MTFRYACEGRENVIPTHIPIVFGEKPELRTDTLPLLGIGVANENSVGDIQIPADKARKSRSVMKRVVCRICNPVWEMGGGRRRHPYETAL